MGEYNARAQIDTPTPDTIREHASRIAFSRPLIQNNLRAIVAEVIIGSALGSDWNHCAADWYGWDFVHKDGTRLEVKQSARRQTWATPSTKYQPRFDVKERTGYWEDGIKWTAQRGRHADIYVFAYHPVEDDSADHCNPTQWCFYVVPTKQLPDKASTIGLSAIAARRPPVEWKELADAIERERHLRVVLKLGTSP